MVDLTGEPMLIIASESELPASHYVWGTGGWLPPEEREALDWLTLTRFMGWGLTMIRRTDRDLARELSGQNRWIILACDPDHLNEGLVEQFASKLATQPILIVARAGAADGVLARLTGVARGKEHITGQSLHWIGAGSEQNWFCRNTLDANPLEISEKTTVWATLESMPLIVACQIGRGVIATLGFHPSQARDADGAATALLKHLLVWGSPEAVAWLDFDNAFVLRMDDPGGAQNVYNRDWSYPKLGEAEWTAIGTDLRRRNARLSIGYVAGWVDDGEASRGILQVEGQEPYRIPGRVYSSPVVKYQNLGGYAPETFHDYEAEFRGIQALRASGLGDIELHGYTHMHPDTKVWARAPDRYEATYWFRELGSNAEVSVAARPLNQHPLDLGINVLQRYFNVRPTTLICPGDEWTNEVLERAIDLGLYFVSSYYLAMRDGDRFCWVTHVCAPYLDEPNTAWFDSGLPVVGYFHDREPALEGVGWMSKWLDRWQEAGARRFIDFRELAAAVGRRLYLEQHVGDISLTVESGEAPPLVKPLPILIKVVDRQMPSHISVSLDGKLIQVRVYPLGKGIGRIILPL